MSKQTNSLFDLTDFRVYVRSWAQAKGRGELRRVAQALRMHTTLLSQVLSGRKCLTEEQTTRLADYMGLSPLESDYFLKLVQLERAGDEPLRKVFSRHLAQLRAQATEVRSRVPESKKMSLQDRAVFYSSWHYSMVRILTSIEGFQTPEKIARRLELSLSRTQEVLDFLVSRSLCERSRDGLYVRTTKNTHIEAQSPLAARHHQNWRTRSLTLVERVGAEELAFTAPVSIARQDIPRVRTILLDAISEISRVVESSNAEEVGYLGIDWLRA